MSQLRIVSFDFALFLLFCFVGSSWERQNATCKYTYQCRRGEICCKNVCATSCVGTYCRFSYQCGQDRCCAYRCKKNCEGSRCNEDRNCGKSLKCCENICRKGSCLGSACNTIFSPRRTCGYHENRALQCCGGNCAQSCQDKPCAENRDCGGWGARMKCCDGVCKRSCLGSACWHRRECHGRLECCGFFGSKICQRTCLNRQCSMNDDCRDRRMTLWCCGDETCRRNCVGSLCHSETFMSDCAGSRTLFCCGIGQKKCRSDCRRVQCKTYDDCGPTFFYCGPPNDRNVSTCTENSHRIYIYRPLEG